MRAEDRFYLIEQLEKHPVRGSVLDTCAGPSRDRYEELFEGKPYFRNDLVNYHGKIDYLCDVCRMSDIEDETFSAVLNFNALEHIHNPFKAIEEMSRILEEEGLLFLSVPMHWRVHRSPTTKDYWRFCPDGVRKLLEGFEILDITIEGCRTPGDWDQSAMDYRTWKTGSTGIWATARKRPSKTTAPGTGKSMQDRESCGPRRDGARGKPNVCLIVLDTVRADHFGCYGYRRDTTPTIDAGAKNGFLFKNAFSTENCTLASHASILSGLMPSQHNAHGKHIHFDPRVKRLPELLKEEGYFTVGSVSIPHLDPKFGAHKGFDDYFITHQNNSVAVCDKALRAVKGLPFFIMLNLTEAHSPYLCPEHRWGNPRTVPPPAAIMDGLTKGRSFDRGLIDNVIDCYDDCIRWLDSRIALLVKALPADTIFIVTADHGEIFHGPPGVACHGSPAGLYDDVLHVPLVIFSELLEAPAVIDDLFSLKNLFHLILDVAREKKEISPYTSPFVLSEHFGNETAVRLYGQPHLKQNQRCIRTKNFKLVENELQEDEFYILPDEGKNLIEDEGSREVIKELRTCLEKHSTLKMDNRYTPWQTTFGQEEGAIERRLQDLGYL